MVCAFRGGIPIVFASVSEPVTSGFVATLGQPGGNITGFALFEATLGGKWLELLSLHFSRNPWRLPQIPGYRIFWVRCKA